MAFHPRESRYGRREFLGRSAVGIAGLSSLSSILAACGGGSNGGSSAVDLRLARPDNPVTWPLYDDNAPIASGLEPEKGPLKIYNWNGYLWPRIMKDFGKEYGVEVELSTFATTDESMAKISSGAVDYDVFFPYQERLGRMVLGKLLQPLNHDYVPNLQTSVWPAFRDPFYDQGSLYTVPYTIYSTGIGYRTDKVTTTPWDLSNPYEIYWDERNSGKTWLLDDGREAPIHMLLKNGILDTNTEKPEDIDLAKQELKSLTPAVTVKLSTDDYTNLPEGKAWVHQMWSGSAISAQWYLPEGTGPEVLGYWYPPDGKGLIGSDMMAVSAVGEESRPRPPLHQLPPRREARLRQLRELRRLPAATHVDRARQARRRRRGREEPEDGGRSGERLPRREPAARAEPRRPDAVAERVGRVQGGCLSPSCPSPAAT